MYSKNEYKRLIIILKGFIKQPVIKQSSPNGVE